MKLYIDTKNPVEMRIEMTEEEDQSLGACIEEMGYGLAGLTMGFLQETESVFTREEILKVKADIVRLYRLYMDRAFEEEDPDKAGHA